MATSLAISPIRHNLLKQFSASQLELIQRTYAKDLVDQEFDLYMSMAAGMGLNPLKKEIYALVFNKSDSAKRQVAFVVGIDGFRTRAARTGNYRPDEQLPVYEYDDKLKDPKANPAGLVSATVRVFKHAHGQWFATPHQVFWDAYAPLVEGGKWEDTGRTKKVKAKDGTEYEKPIWEFVSNGERWLDPSKARWKQDPRGMLAKCAEAGAIRKAFPDEFAGVYGSEEMDAAHTLDLTASEYAETSRMDARLAMIGAKDAITFEFLPEPAGYVPVGKVADRIHEWLERYKDDPEAIETFMERNQHGLKEFWALAKTDAMAVKKKVEAIQEFHKKNPKAKPEEETAKQEGGAEAHGC